MEKLKTQCKELYLQQVATQCPLLILYVWSLDSIANNSYYKSKE